MLLNINIEKSIEKKKIYPESKFDFYINYLIYGIPALLFTVVAIVKFVQEQNDEMNGNVIVGMALCIVISTLTFYNLFNMDKLTELTIKDKQKTKQYIHSLIKKNKWEVKKENDEILIINANLSNIPERQLSFIFRNNNLFINTITIRDNLKSTLFYNHDKRFTESIINNLTDNDLIQSCNS